MSWKKSKWKVSHRSLPECISPTGRRWMVCCWVAVEGACPCCRGWRNWQAKVMGLTDSHPGTNRLQRSYSGLQPGSCSCRPQHRAPLPGGQHQNITLFNNSDSPTLSFIALRLSNCATLLKKGVKMFWNVALSHLGFTFQIPATDPALMFSIILFIIHSFSLFFPHTNKSQNVGNDRCLGQSSWNWMLRNVRVKWEAALRKRRCSLLMIQSK